jgi:RNA polymerase sigma factor (sigma-70 family)
VRVHQHASFTEFYAAARDDCLRAVVASTGDPAAAEDFVAEAFARAWASWRKVSGHPAPRAWVVRTALNLSVSSWRRHRNREVSLDAAPGLAVAGQVTAGRAVAGRAVDDRAGHGEPAGTDTAALMAALMAMLATLPQRQRQVVALRVFLDLDTAATAEVLGIAPGTVTAHLARATAALRTQLSRASRQEI